MKRVTYDYATYQRCSAPRPRAEVEASVAAFEEELATLRIKHQLAELVCIVETPVIDEPSQMVVFQRGDSRLIKHLLSTVLLALSSPKEKP